MTTAKRFRRNWGSIAILVSLACVWRNPALAGEGLLSPAPAAAPPAFQLTDVDGRESNLDALRGKIVVVNFWASWCTPCIEEMPSIQRLAETMRDKPVAVIGVNVEEGLLRVKTIVQRLGIEFPVLLDQDGAVFKRWGADVLPTTYLLDSQGVVRYVGRGPLEWDAPEIVQLLDELMQPSAGAPDGG